MNDMKKSKMYILVKDGLDVGMATVACAHASLSGYLTFLEKDKINQSTIVEDWVSQSFRKAVCSVNDEQFEEAKTYGIIGEDYRIITESSLGGAEVAIVFRPMVEWEQFFRNLPLYGEK